MQARRCAGRDRIFGWGSDDILMGSAGTDELDGDEGNDSGNDFLDGGDGSDQLIGRAGRDRFALTRRQGRDLSHSGLSKQP